jgi:hypothetical protein
VANYCGRCEYGASRSGTPNGEVLGDFEEFFHELKPQLVAFLRGDLCWPSVCEGHGTNVLLYMDWHGGFWLLHRANKEQRKDAEEGGYWHQVPGPLRIPDGGQLTRDQLKDLDAMRGWSAEQIKECIDPTLYGQLVALGVPPDGPPKLKKAKPVKPSSAKKLKNARRTASSGKSAARRGR